MIKCVIFDLDGVLFDTREMHFNVLNQALMKISPNYVISEVDHLQNFNGLTTKTKLRLLTDRGLDESLHQSIYDLKQALTLTWLEENIHRNELLRNLFSVLSGTGLKLAVASNSIKNTVWTFLERSELVTYLSMITSNEDVSLPKPNPEMYLATMAKLGVSPFETLIVEDSPVGVTAANASGANVLHVSNPQELTLNRINEAIKTLVSCKNDLIVPNLNVIVPMAGQGSRYVAEGYKLPKPLIDIKGRPMIKIVTDSLGLQANFTFLVRSEHIEKYQIDTTLKLIKPACKIVTVDQLTEGAACTLLLAWQSEYCYQLDSDQPLLIVNSDQYVEWNYVEFMQKMHLKNADAGILTFRDTVAKWSFAKLDENGYVTEVAEKQPISDIATCGIYYWKRAGDFYRFANQMIDKDIRTNGEFYICPVFNEAIQAGLKVITFDVNKMMGLGTPEDLKEYLKCY